MRIVGKQRASRNRMRRPRRPRITSSPRLCQGYARDVIAPGVTPSLSRGDSHLLHVSTQTHVVAIVAKRKARIELFGTVALPDVVAREHVAPRIAERERDR